MAESERDAFSRQMREILREIEDELLGDASKLKTDAVNLSRLGTDLSILRNRFNRRMASIQRQTGVDLKKSPASVKLLEDFGALLMFGERLSNLSGQYSELASKFETASSDFVEQGRRLIVALDEFDPTAR